MKKVIAVIILIAANITPAYADVYVAVDKDGNVVSGAIMCDANTCGADSLYSKLTLQEGQHYVLQNNGSAGIGNNNPDTTVKVNEVTNVWTVTTPTTIQQYNKTIDNPIVNEPVVSVVDTATVVVDTATVTVDTATVTINSATVTNATTNTEVMTLIYALLDKIMTLLARLKG